MPACFSGGSIEVMIHPKKHLEKIDITIDITSTA
jgi:hypothetical protein